MEEVNKTVWVHFFGKKYQVPTNFTIMGAMEWVGYQLRHGCGCRGGKCGACACLYRIDGKKGLHGCLAVRWIFAEVARFRKLSLSFIPKSITVWGAMPVPGLVPRN